MKFNELDLRHSATFLYKLNHLKASPDIISELQILSLFYSNVIYYTSSDETSLFEVGDVVCGQEIVRSEYDKIGAIYFNEPISEVSGFVGLGITSISIPYGVISIGESAFAGCRGLTSITIPNNVTSIGNYAFNGCSSLTSVTIGNSVTSIGSDAFAGCFSITSMVVKDGNTSYDSRDNCNAIIGTATNILIVGCQKTIIPNSVTEIGGGAFHGCSSLTSITIPNSVTKIGGWAFCNCSGLTSVTIGNRVTSIGDYAFWNCKSLTSVTIPNSVTSIGSVAFNNCSSLTSIIIPDSVTRIANDAFEGCTFNEENFINLSSLDAEANNYWGATIIKAAVKEYVDLGLPSGILWATRNVGANRPEEYGDYFAWGETQPKDYYGWSNYKWGNGKDNALTKYNIDSSYGTVDNKTVLEADDDAATANWGGNWRMPTEAERYELETHCTWEQATHNGVNGYKGISNNNGKSIFLPAAGSFGSELHNVGTYCSYWTSSLNTDSPVLAYRNAQGSVQQSTARYYGFSVRPVCTSPSPTPDPEPDLEKCGENAYYSVNDGVLTISGEGIIDDCASDSAPWAREEITEVVIEEGITVLGAHMLRGSNITSVTIPNSVTTINTYAFYGCKNLQEVTIGSGLTRINSSAFNSCPNITRVNVGSIEQWCGIKFDVGITANPMNSNNAALYVNGSAMYDIVVPEGVTVLRNYVFDGNHITSLTLPSTLTEIQSQAIGGCSNCTTITCYAQTPPKMAGKNQISSVTTVYVPAGCVQAYQEASNWANYGNLIVEL